MIRRVVLLVAVTSTLTACGDNSAPLAVPTPMPITAYTERIPGRWALVVDTDGASADVTPSGMRCEHFDYPLDLGTPLRQAGLEALGQAAAEMRVVDHRLSRSELESQNITGVVVLRLSNVHASADAGGLLTPSIHASVDLVAELAVQRDGQQIFESTETGKGEAVRSLGLTCSGADDALRSAAATALEDALRKLAERFANAPALRNPGSRFAPATAQ